MSSCRTTPLPASRRSRSSPPAPASLHHPSCASSPGSASTPMPTSQRRLKEELEAQLQSPLMKRTPADRQGSAFADFRARRLVEPGADLRRDTSGRVRRDHRFARRYEEAHPPFVGGRFTEAIALYAVRHLRVVRPDVALVEGQAATWRDQVIDFGKRDVLVVFDIRRYQEDVVLLAEEAADRRPSTIVLFTDQWLSPVARVAKHVISARIAPCHRTGTSYAAIFRRRRGADRIPDQKALGGCRGAHEGARRATQEGAIGASVEPHAGARRPRPWRRSRTAGQSLATGRPRPTAGATRRR